MARNTSISNKKEQNQGGTQLWCQERSARAIRLDTMRHDMHRRSFGSGNRESAPRGPDGDARLSTADRWPGVLRGRTRSVSGSVCWLLTGARTLP